MFKKDIWRFGAVDVTDETGLVRHGMVQDIAPDGGLIVNFDYRGHRAEPVVVSACVKQIAQYPPALREPVEVLYQYRGDQSWRWWPEQTVMLGSYNEYASVKINFDDRTLQEILPMERVRVPMPYVSQSSPFYKRLLPIRKLLPTFCQKIRLPFADRKTVKLITRSDNFAQRWERESGTKVVTLNGVDHLIYLSPKKDFMDDIYSKCHEYLARIGSAIDAEQQFSSSPNGGQDCAVPALWQLWRYRLFPMTFDTKTYPEFSTSKSFRI